MADKKNLYVDIIGPERPVYSGEAVSITAQAWDGSLGIMPGHAPMVTKLGIGEVRVTSTDDKVSRFAIKQGYLEVSHDKVVVLSEDALDVTELKGVNPEDIERIVKLLADETDPHRKAELQADLEWLKSCDKLLKAV
ncbi:MAG: ATP synthase F1 subunit epsilon [Planctomycetes bacterium]|nr:ATP synthase F1 subunit epsilon [Planctomycetota bacterium]